MLECFASARIDLDGFGCCEEPRTSSVRVFSTRDGGSRRSPQMNASINATDAPAFTPNVVVVPNGTSVRFHVSNIGTFPHTFTLLKSANLVVPRNATPAQVYQDLNRNGTIVNVSIAPKSSVTFNVTFTPVYGSGATTASYEFLSAVPYQFQAGMFGFANVTTTPSGPGQALFLNGTGAYQWLPANLGVENVTHFPVVIDVLVGDIGSLPHTWTLDPVPNDVNITPANWPTVLKSHPPPSGANVSVSGSGATAWANFSLEKAGVFTFICTVAGHYQNGMNGSLYVNVPIPLSAIQSTAIVNPILLAGAAALFGAGVIIAIVAQLRGRFSSAPADESSYH